eukprot:TRINITY_DN10542_c0_g2_i2.p2 TRINITY_DN10542_c0_g2~~TRINITY_DN10542_c0_g2_i2.p2  ORF type:complete len:276 (+),score=45.31 TRINITY_DN10542_c0_g2_i2:64-891(+)
MNEAGRGPVLGPMVYAVAYCPLDFEEQLKNLEFADSKQLTEYHRDKLFQKIKEEPKIGYEHDVIHAETISYKMLSWEQVSLNVLANESTYALIEKVLQKGVNIKKVYVVTVGDAQLYKVRLMDKFEGIEFVVESKADATFVIVSAASIVAKVTRDSVLANFQFVEKNLQINRNWGCGYPGDADTKMWLLNNLDEVFGFTRIVRFSWQTAQTIIQEKCVDVKFESEVIDEKEDPRQQKLDFGMTTKRKYSALNSTPSNTRHGFFKLRKLQKVAGFL